MKSWFIFTRTWSRNSAKLFSRKLCHAICPRNLMQSCSHSIRKKCAHFIQPMFVINARVSERVFLQTTLMIFCIVRELWVKKSRVHPVIGGVSLQQHLLLGTQKFKNGGALDALRRWKAAIWGTHSRLFTFFGSISHFVLIPIWPWCEMS